MGDSNKSLQIGYTDLLQNFLALSDLSHFVCRLPSQTDDEADIKYRESVRMKK